MTMFAKTVHDAMNKQINHELYSSYLYLAMAAHFEKEGLPGFATWMMAQSEEERAHAMKFFHYIYERGGSVVLEEIGKPPAKFKKPLDVMTQVLEHERKVTALITSIYDIAVKEKDYPSQAMLQWFVTEQVEEEKTAADVVDRLTKIGDAPAMLFMMDAQMGARKKG
jgi:ferritin